MFEPTIFYLQGKYYDHYNIHEEMTCNCVKKQNKHWFSWWCTPAFMK